MKINITLQQKRHAQRLKKALGISSLVLLFLFSLQSMAQCGGPQISYSGVSATYGVGSAITPLVPINTGSAPSSNPTHTDTFNSNLNSPSSLAMDSQGNVYVADTAANMVKKFSPQGVLINTYGATGTTAVTVDNQDNIYFSVSIGGNMILARLDATGNSTGITYPPFEIIRGLAVDSNLNLYVLDNSTTVATRIRRFSPTGVLLNTNFSPAPAVSVGTLGSANSNHILFTEDNYVYSYNQDGTLRASYNLGDGLLCMGVTEDSEGNIYVACALNIKKITPNGTITTVATVGSNPKGLCVDSMGNLYFTGPPNGVVSKITVGNAEIYRILPSLPLGLSLNTSTGIISGSPTVVSPPTTYTIVTQNPCAQNSTTIRFATANSCPSITSQPGNTTLCGTVGATASVSVSTDAPATSYSWQYRLVTTANPNPAWITITSANAAVYANYNTATLGITRTATLPMNGTQYRVVMTTDCGALTSDTASLAVVSMTKGGTIAVASTNVCIGNALTFTLTGYSGTSLQWQSAPTAAGTFTNIGGATASSYTLTNAQLNSNKSYRVVVSNSCNETIAVSTVKTIMVNPLSVGGTAIGGGPICSGGATRMSVVGHTGKVQWQYSTDGENYINAPKAADGQTSPFSTTSASSAIASYMIGNLSANLYFRAKVTSGSCDAAYSNAIHYTLENEALVGTVTPDNSTICSGTTTTLHLSSALGAITWEKSINYATETPTWTPISSSNVLNYTTQILTYNTAFRAKVTIGSCSTVYSNVAYVYLYGKPVAKSLMKNTTTPSGSSSATALCLTDASKVLTIGAGYSGAIQWQWSTTSTTAGFTDLDGETGTSYTITSAAAGPNYYRVKLTNECGVQANGAAAIVYYKECVLTKQLPNDFDVVAYPNPYQNQFSLRLTTSHDEQATIAVYDMTGKLVERNELSPTEVSILSIGKNYPAGIYNVVVTQGNDLKTLRVIKR